MLRLQDGFGREFRYLRLSVTEACNFRCTYCLPNGYRKSAARDFLCVDEIARLVRAFRTVGVGKVRLTGGEPSVRKDLTDIIEAVAGAGVAKVALTTNGWSLARRIRDWTSAGLSHLNVSVDSLDAEGFAKITGRDRLGEVLAGVDSALECKLQSVKLNAVLLRDTVDNSFGAFADFVRARPISIRFIELMRTADNADYFEAQQVPGQRLRDWLIGGGWAPVDREIDAGPAVEYAHPDYRGRFGLIAPYGAGFCDSCNRLRVTARGRLRLCLFGNGGVDLRDLLQRDSDASDLCTRIGAVLGAKPAGHRLAAGKFGDLRQLAEVGG